MPAPKFTPNLAKEYSDLFNRCQIAPDKLTEVNEVVERILHFKNLYAPIAAQSTVPWYVIAVIHNMECGLSFAKHLHNGDSLERRTVNMPAGRPKTGQPPFTFEASALDALELDGLTKWSDWSIGGICYKLEGYNGWGYRAHNVNSPYLWSYSNLYTMGKYVEDNQWSDTAISRQCGAAVILRRMSDQGAIDLASPPSPKLADAATLAEVPRRLFAG
ncbi:MAG: peptidoglycan-binding protein [Verrucomicrobia bacterium]|nr:MAG: peptidoglycan-binding protein [Verrucomicrobiota bacterium]